MDLHTTRQRLTKAKIGLSSCVGRTTDIAFGTEQRLTDVDDSDGPGELWVQR